MLDQLTKEAAKAAPSLSTVSDFPEPKQEAPAEAPAPSDDGTPPAAPEGEHEDDPGTSDDGSDTAANTDKGKTPKGVQKRIDELTRKFNDEKRARETLEQRLADEQRHRLQVQPTDDPEPQRDEFDNPDEYSEQRAQWMVRKTLRDERAKEVDQVNQARAKENFDRLANDWQSGMTKAIEKYPDYKEVVESDGLNIAQHVSFALLSHPQGHEIAYHLGKHPEEAERISALNPLHAAFAIQSLGEQLTEKPVANPKPVKPVGARSAASKPVNELSMDEYAASRNDTLREARKRR